MQHLMILPRTQMIEQKEQAVLKQLLPSLLQILFLTRKDLNTYGEIQQAVEQEFNCICPLDLIIDYYAQQREFEDLQLIHKHNGNDYQCGCLSEI